MIPGDNNAKRRGLLYAALIVVVNIVVVIGLLKGRQTRMKLTNNLIASVVPFILR